MDEQDDNLDELKKLASQLLQKIEKSEERLKIQ